MQANAFQLDSFQQDAGASSVFQLQPTAALGITGTLSVAGDIAFAMAVATAAALAINGTVAIAGDTQYSAAVVAESTGGWPSWRDLPRRKKLREEIAEERQVIEALDDEAEARQRQIALAKTQQTRERERERLRRIEARREEHEAKLLALSKTLAALMRDEQEEAEARELFELFMHEM